MGEVKTEELNDTVEFIGGLTEKEYFKRLNFLRKNGGHK
jgi:hypothetical protein